MRILSYVGCINEYSGSDNTIRAIIENHIKSIVCLSTGKVVYPVNGHEQSDNRKWNKKDLEFETAISRAEKYVALYGNLLNHNK